MSFPMPSFSRRQFLVSSAAAAATLRARAAAPVKARRIYIGTSGNGPGKGILVANWNEATGEIGTPELAAEVATPAFLALYRRGGTGFLYAVSEVDSPNAPVSAYRIDAGTGKLQLINQVEAGGKGPTHLSISPDGRTIVVANYGAGSLSSYQVQPDGSLKGPVSHFQYTGSGPYKGRQEAPHTHSAMVTPDGQSVLVNDLGLDRIFIYALDPASSVLTAAATPFYAAKPGSGPRHIAFSPKGDIVYSDNELTSTVDVLRWDAKGRTLRLLSSISTLPKGFPPNTAFVGEIVASADGRNVYAGNRVADDTIAVFNVVPGLAGTLDPQQFADSGGQNCRHIALDPSQRWMVVSHQKSSDLTVLERDRKSGRLSPPVRKVAVEHPMCVVFGG